MKSTGKSANETIQIEAYLLSEKAGHPGGMEAHFWAEAESIVAARVAAKGKGSAAKRLAVKAKPKAKAAAPAKKDKKKKK